MALALTMTMYSQGMAFFNVVPSGSYSTGGDTLDLTKMTQDVNFVGMAPGFIPSDQAPISIDVWDTGGNVTNGVMCVAGTTQANAKLKFLTAFGTELGAGAYPASITSSKFQGQAVFNINI